MVKERMNLREAQQYIIKVLKIANIEAPVFEAGVLLCHVLNCDKVFLYANPDRVLSNDDLSKLEMKLNERTNGRPLQYIIGHQEFMSLDFYVDENVLVPRQDTEILVEHVIEQFEKSENMNILDIGSGSGCIAISLAHFLKNAQVKSVDISPNALEVARKNALQNNVSVEFIQSDLFQVFEGDTKYQSSFDAIVSNPPYIKKLDILELEKQVKDFEPLSALDGGEDGLDFYRNIVKDSLKYLKLGGLLAFEVGIYQWKDVAKMMELEFVDIQIIKDLSGIERVVSGKKR